MNWLPLPKLALMLQSNETIARAIGQGQALAPQWTSYAGQVTGIFATIFLMMISAWAAVVHNYGLAIILTAVMVRALLLPLTRMQIRGMKTMQQLQPVMKEIQRFYPNKQAQSAKMMELYQTYKVNPLAGCLPMLIQLPILFGVYRALYDPSFAGKDFLGIQLLFPVSVTSGRSFGAGPDLADLIDITVAKMGLQWQIFRVPETIPVIGGAFWYWPALALVVLYVLTSVLMQRYMRVVNAPDPEFAAEFKQEMHTSGEGPKEPDMAQQMQRQMGLMNLMLIVFAFIFSAGALLYFIVQNMLMVLEYTFLPRGMQLTMNAKDMKSFIRRPPDMSKTPGQAAGKDGKPVARGVDATGRPVPSDDPAAENGDAGGVDDEAAADDDAIQEGARAVAGSSSEAATSLRRPRKKRRKK